MQTASRAAPHFLLGTFTLLAFGGFLLSLDTAPPNADQQLHQAAKDTVAVGSFVLDDTLSLVPGTSAAASQARTETALVVYRAPDAVRETLEVGGRTLTVLAIGTQRYERRDSGKWVALGSQAATIPTGSQAAAGVLGPLEVFTTATDVVRHDDSYTFVPAPGQLTVLLGELLGSEGAQLPPGSATFAATVSGEFLHSVDVTAVVPGGRVLVHLVLGSLDRAPLLEAPPAPQTTPRS